MSYFNKLQGLYKHTSSGKLYNVLGLGRSVDNPNIPIVIYRQNYESVLKGTDIKLPKGFLWTRTLEDFTKKFTKLSN